MNKMITLVVVVLCLMSCGSGEEIDSYSDSSWTLRDDQEYCRRQAMQLPLPPENRYKPWSSYHPPVCDRYGIPVPGLRDGRSPR